jgi:hypothetical protein
MKKVRYEDSLLHSLSNKFTEMSKYCTGSAKSHCLQWVLTGEGDDGVSVDRLYESRALV